MMNKLINPPQTANQLASNMLPKLRMVLYHTLHNIFLVALGLIILAFIFNFTDRLSKKNN